MKRIRWASGLTVMGILLGAFPAFPQCGRMRTVQVTCCGTTASVDACAQGRDSCYVVMPGIPCVGSCYAATATDEYPCDLQTRFGPGIRSGARLIRAVTLAMKRCTGDSLTVVTELAGES